MADDPTSVRKPMDPDRTTSTQCPAVGQLICTVSSGYIPQQPSEGTTRPDPRAHNLTVPSRRPSARCRGEQRTSLVPPIRHDRDAHVLHHRGCKVHGLSGLMPTSSLRTIEQARYDVGLPLLPGTATMTARIEVTMVRGQHNQPVLPCKRRTRSHSIQQLAQVAVQPLDRILVLTAHAPGVGDLVGLTEVDERQVWILVTKFSHRSVPDQWIRRLEPSGILSPVEERQSVHAGSKDRARTVMGTENQRRCCRKRTNLTVRTVRTRQHRRIPVQQMILVSVPRHLVRRRPNPCVQSRPANGSHGVRNVDIRELCRPPTTACRHRLHRPRGKRTQTIVAHTVKPDEEHLPPLTLARVSHYFINLSLNLTSTRAGDCGHRK
jgi:hypothetical protein